MVSQTANRSRSAATVDQDTADTSRRTVDDRLVTSTTIDCNRSPIDSRFIGQAILSLRNRQAAVVESQLGSARFSTDGAIGSFQLDCIVTQADVICQCYRIRTAIFIGFPINIDVLACGNSRLSCCCFAVDFFQLFFGSSSATAICKISRSCCLIRQARDFTGITVDGNRIRLPDSDGRSQVDVSSSLVDSEVIRQFSRYGVLLDTIFYCTRNGDTIFTCHIRCRLNSCIIDVNSIGLGLSIVAFCNRRVRAIDNFYSFLSQVIDDRLAAFCDVGEVRLGDARNRCFTSHRLAIAVNVGHGNGTILIYGIFLRFDMTIFTFGEVLNVRVTFFSDIGETRICQIFSRKGNFTIFSTFND